MMPIQSKIKSYTGVVLTGFCLVTLVKVLGQPLKPQIAESTLPMQLALSTWTPIDSGVQSPIPTEASYDQLLQGRFYNFKKDNQSLQLQIGYFVNTNGDVVVLQDRLNPKVNDVEVSQAKISWEEDSVPQVGDYLVGQNDQQEQMLLTCINPKGQNTATREQFANNRLSHDFNVTQIGRWFLGRSQLLDKRCLWGRLSLTTPTPDQDSSTLLKNIWLELQPQLNDIL